MEEETPKPETRYYRDSTRSIITYNQSPDIPFDASLNPYRGCEHGCIYCYARPTHEYLGFSLGLDFETHIMVKEKAPALLRAELSQRSWKPQVLALSGVTDPYQPLERRMQLTRQCLQVLLEFHNPVMVATKNYLVTRDLDIFRKMAEYQGVSVLISIPTLLEDLSRILEPRTSRPLRRLEAIRKLSEAGVPVGVLVAPIIPALTVEDLPAVLQAAVTAGAQFAASILLRLPYGLTDLFSDWLEQHYPERKEKVLSQIRQIRGGKLNDPHFKTRMSGIGIFAEQIHQLFELSCQKAGLPHQHPRLSSASFRRLEDEQMVLF